MIPIATSDRSTFSFASNNAGCWRGCGKSGSRWRSTSSDHRRDRAYQQRRCPLPAVASDPRVRPAGFDGDGSRHRLWGGLPPGARLCGLGWRRATPILDWGKQKLFGISKRGNVYLRRLLIHGARAVLLRVKYDTGGFGQWVHQLAARAPGNKVVVAIANKLARIAWAVLSSGKDYQHQPLSISAA